jgi:hypothetical protein
MGCGMTDAPILSVREIPNNDGTILIVSVRCPHCGNIHVHGVGNPSHPLLGSRIAQCSPADCTSIEIPTYVITDPDRILG